MTILDVELSLDLSLRLVLSRVTPSVFLAAERKTPSNL